MYFKCKAKQFTKEKNFDIVKNIFNTSGNCQINTEVAEINEQW